MAFASDYVSRDPKVIRQSKKWDAAEAYFKQTGKKAEISNLLKSIAIEYHNWQDLLEIVDALNVIILSDEESKELIQQVVSCYERNTNWLIRIRCVAALGRLDEKKSDQCAHEVLADPKVELEGKLMLAMEILERGRLFGYPVLREGLTTDNKYVHDVIAVRLMKDFEKYDGKEYEKGKKIDMKAMGSLLQNSSPDNKNSGNPLKNQ
jgi:hypothetical protein